jgi:hypothetical protein
MQNEEVVIERVENKCEDEKLAGDTCTSPLAKSPEVIIKKKEISKRTIKSVSPKKLKKAMVDKENSESPSPLKQIHVKLSPTSNKLNLI